MGPNEIDRSKISSKNNRVRKKALKTHNKKVKKLNENPTSFGDKTFSSVNQNTVNNGMKPKTKDFLILHSSVEGKLV